MFGDIARFLINVICTLLGIALILRAWMQAVRLPPRNPVSQGVFTATNWLVLPLRRVIPSLGGIDWASLIGAWLTAIVSLLLVITLLVGTLVPGLFPMVLVAALLTVAKWAISLLVWATLLMAVMSWVNPRAPTMAVLDYMISPLLAPIRRVLPSMGGLDLSPLVLLVLAQVVSMVISRLGSTLLIGF